MATTNALTGLLVCACLVLSVHAQFTYKPYFPSITLPPINIPTIKRPFQFTYKPLFPSITLPPINFPTYKPPFWTPGRGVHVPIGNGGLYIHPIIRPLSGFYGAKITIPFGRRRRSTGKRDTAGDEVNRTVSLRCDVDNADHLVALIALMNKELTTSGRNPVDFFRRLDADGDGALSREELQKYIIEAFGLTS